MGVLRVDVLNAKGLGAADRSGKSDVRVPLNQQQLSRLTPQQPYVVFTLNGQKVFKSETKKK